MIISSGNANDYQISPPPPMSTTFSVSHTSYVDTCIHLYHMTKRAVLAA